MDGCPLLVREKRMNILYTLKYYCLWISLLYIVGNTSLISKGIYVHGRNLENIGKH